MKSILLALLSVYSLSSVADSFEPSTSTLTVPLVTVGTNVYKDVDIKLSDYTVNKYTRIKNDITDATLILTTTIKNFAGLKSNSIFVTSTGITFIVDSSESEIISFKESNPTVTIYQLQDKSFTLKLNLEEVKIKPFIFQSIINSTLDSFLGLKSKSVFVSNGIVWEAESTLPIDLGSAIVIYDRSLLLFNGTTYKIKQVN